MRTRPTSRLRAITGVLLTVGLVTAVVPVAASAHGSGRGHRRGGHRPALTAEQRQCLADHGVTMPTRGTKLDDTTRAALAAALTECGIVRHDRGWHHRVLTAEQQQCLADHGVTVPPRGTKLDDATRAALEAALVACGIVGPKGKVPEPTPPAAASDASAPPPPTAGAPRSDGRPPHGPAFAPGGGAGGDHGGRGGDDRSFAGRPGSGSPRAGHQGGGYQGGDRQGGGFGGSRGGGRGR
jgi:hypothetical protein